MNADNPNTFLNQDQEEIHNAPEPIERESDFDEINKDPLEDDSDGFATEDEQFDDDLIKENPDLGSTENEEAGDARYGDDFDSDDDDRDGSRITEQL
ncbi:hypothetical protein [Flavobacterium selenitireducens]|uniref:hypothetical protein n=1 Tax=Flavobacterium selenitireducens TaxID=2722704 RepID=UPI00168AE62C|nr:hypothetical protein [Flavobacterium selenitireducens]MBD3583073.1 hypothetical protein [Flavobacterium selenitireducens]